MLPLFAVGAGLLMAGKVASDMDEAKKYAEWAREEADDGNYYLNQAKEYKSDIEYKIKKASNTVTNAKEEGIKCLLNNFSYFKDIDLKEKENKKLRKTIEDDIEKYKLDITLNEVMELKPNVERIADELGINLKSHNIEGEFVESVAVETFAGLAAHGIMAAGIGGIAALAGAEFLMATGVGAIIVAPIALAVSSDKVDEAKKAYYRAQSFKDEAKVEKEKWKGKLAYINMFNDVANFYYDFIISTNSVSDYWLERFKISDNKEIISKNLIALAYLNKFIQYQYVGKDETSDLDNLINWIKWNAEDETKKFNELQNTISKLKEN